MAQETEIEFKNLSTQEEYQQLLNTFNLTHKDIKEQTNHYFDTPNGLLKQKKRGLRIRVLSAKSEFTLKTPGKDDYTYLEITDYLETYNKNLSLTEQSFHPTSDVLTFLEKENFPINELNQIGSLTTYRSEIKLNPDVLLVLDESHYGGIKDFELEMEVTDTQSGHEFFTHFLKEHQIPLRPAKKKIARMFEQSLKSQA